MNLLGISMVRIKEGQWFECCWSESRVELQKRGQGVLERTQSDTVGFLIYTRVAHGTCEKGDRSPTCELRMVCARVSQDTEAQWLIFGARDQLRNRILADKCPVEMVQGRGGGN